MRENPTQGWTEEYIADLATFIQGIIYILIYVCVYEYMSIYTYTYLFISLNIKDILHDRKTAIEKMRILSM